MPLRPAADPSAPRPALGGRGRTAVPPDHTRLLAARRLAEALPDLLVEASRVAAAVAAGWHGRRRAGSGETFWQYRPYDPGESAARIDWRRSARDDEPRVREREWQAAHTVWLAPDLSPSMDWGSPLARVTKRDRAVVLALALADLLGRAGERVGMPGLVAPRSERRAAERLAEALARTSEGPALPEAVALGPYCDVVVIGDFLDPLDQIERRLAALAAEGARLHLLRVVDPAEPDPPWTGNVEFRDPETGEIFHGARAEAVRDDWRRVWAARGEALEALARPRRWTLLAHRTDRSPAEALLALHVALGGPRHGLGREPRGAGA